MKSIDLESGGSNGLPDPILYIIIFTSFMVLERDFIVQAGTKQSHLSTKCCFCFELRFEYDFPCLARG